MIHVDSLTKFYGPTRSLNGLSFDVPEGEVLGLLGPNGAGKTTTMRILTGLSRPTKGSATVAGFDTVRQHQELRRVLGYLPEDAPMYPEMRVEQYLRFMAHMKEISRGKITSEVDRVIEETDLGGWRKRLISNLSKGTAQRVGLAQAILGEPRVVILDEPTVGLDPSQISEVRGLIARMRGRRTVILSTHILPEVSMTCTRVVIINKGELVAQGTLQQIEDTLGRRRIDFSVRRKSDADDAALEEILRPHLNPEDEWAGTESLADNVVRGSIRPAKNSLPSPAIARALIENGYDMLDLREVRPTLEDMFISATSKSAEATTK